MNQSRNLGPSDPFLKPSEKSVGKLCPRTIRVKYIIAGGFDNTYVDDVLTYVPETSDWKKIGSMKTARDYHGASLVNMEDVIDYCI